MNRPMGLAWGNGFLYVADTENGAIKKFREDGSLVSEWTGFKRPVAVATVGDVVYVADFLTDRAVVVRIRREAVSKKGIGPGWAVLSLDGRRFEKLRKRFEKVELDEATRELILTRSFF